MKLYTQRTRKAGDAEMNRPWIEGISSSDRTEIVNNIMETVLRKHSISEDEEMEKWDDLEKTGRIQIDTTTYDIHESEED